MHTLQIALYASLEVQEVIASSTSDIAKTISKYFSCHKNGLKKKKRRDDRHKHLHAGVWLLLGEVAGEAQVGDANMTVLVQQDISWLKERREGERGRE